MIALLLAYLTFQILFDHWADNSVVWKVIYFAFQYGWIAAVAVHQALIGKHRLVLILIAVIFACLTINELTFLYVDSRTYAMMSSSPPAYALTIMAISAYIIYEVITRWRKRLN